MSVVRWELLNLGQEHPQIFFDSWITYLFSSRENEKDGGQSTMVTYSQYICNLPNIWTGTSKHIDYTDHIMRTFACLIEASITVQMKNSQIVVSKIICTDFIW